MADETIKPNPPVDTAALMAEVESLRKSKAELLDDYKKAKEAARAVPPDVDVDALIAYKQKKEQEYRKAEIQEAIVTWSLTGVILATGSGMIGLIIYMVA